MTKASKCSQFMVRSVVDAKPWHPVSYVRQQMLTYAFSYLPIWHHDAWKLIPEYSVARLLRGASSNALRGRHLIAQVSDAIEKSNLELLDAHVVPPEMPLAEVLQLICERPVLVVDKTRPDVLVGLLTSSDIL
jgi:predicted transcriptional regulator